jgi:hypothetical protein
VAYALVRAASTLVSMPAKESREVSTRHAERVRHVGLIYWLICVTHYAGTRLVAGYRVITVRMSAWHTLNSSSPPCERI